MLDKQLKDCSTIPTEGFHFNIGQEITKEYELQLLTQNVNVFTFQLCTALKKIKPIWPLSIGSAPY